MGKEFINQYRGVGLNLYQINCFASSDRASGYVDSCYNEDLPTVGISAIIVLRKEFAKLGMQGRLFEVAK